MRAKERECVKYSINDLLQVSECLMGSDEEGAGITDIRHDAHKERDSLWIRILTVVTKRISHASPDNEPTFLGNAHPTVTLPDLTLTESYKHLSY